MKKLVVLFAFLFLALNTFADQLAYLSKEDAERGAMLIRDHKQLILFCGCCDKDSAEKVKVKEVEVKYTNYELFFEIYITYKDPVEKVMKTIPIDLAYVWVKVKGEVKTVGEVLGLVHDPCSSPPDWKPKK